MTTEKHSPSDNKLRMAKLLTSEAPELQCKRKFGQIVAKFQDMAYGYAYSLLHDQGLAEEAAQEAFLTAWQKLPQLQNPQAFPSWFKRIVFTQSYSIGRRRRLQTVALSDLTNAEREQFSAADASLDPQVALEIRERQSAVRQAIGELPETERTVIVLFYINEYSREEIAEFLGITPLAVKKRLASARERLKKRMIHMVQDELYDQRPSRDNAFTQRVLAFSQQFSNLLGSGTPILKTLKLCAADQKESPRLQQAIQEMEQKVQKGEPIGDVMGNYPDLFSEHYIEAVHFGEVNGTLDIVLERLAHGERFDTKEKKIAFQEEMRNRHETQKQVPQVMTMFPHLFKENDLRALSIGEETGTVQYVVQRLTGGIEYDSETKLQALLAEMERLGEWFRSSPGKS